MCLGNTGWHPPHITNTPHHLCHISLWVTASLSHWVCLVQSLTSSLFILQDKVNPHLNYL